MSGSPFKFLFSTTDTLSREVACIPFDNIKTSLFIQAKLAQLKIKVSRFKVSSSFFFVFLFLYLRTAFSFGIVLRNIVSE